MSDQITALDGLNLGLLEGEMKPINDFSDFATSELPELDQILDKEEDKSLPPDPAEAGSAGKTPAAKKSDTEPGKDKNAEPVTDDVPDTSQKDNTDTSAAAQDSPHQLIAELLKERGVISNIPENFDPSDEGLASLVEQEAETRADSKVTSYKDSLPDEIKQLTEKYEEGVPIRELLRRELSVAEYEAIKPENLKDNPSLQKSVIKDLLTRTGFTDAEAQEEVEEYETTGVLESKASKHLKKLVELENKEKDAWETEQKKSYKAEQDKAKERIGLLEKAVQESKEFIPGFTLSSEDRKKIMNGLTRVVDKDEYGRPLNAVGKFMKENPNFQFVLADLILLRNGDIASLASKLESKATVALKNKLNGGVPKPSKLDSMDISIIKNALKVK